MFELGSREKMTEMQQQRLAPEVPDESALYSPILNGLRLNA